MTTNKKSLIVIIALAVAIGIILFFRTQKNESGLSDTPVVTQVSDKDTVNNLIKDFYGALESQDGKRLFGYFTPPTTSEERISFTWLTGADLAGGPVYRAFLRQKISNSKINETQKIDDTTFVVKIDDQLLVTPSAGSETTVYTPKSRNVVLTVVKIDGRWMIDKFTDPSNISNAGNDSAPKYSGFGQ